jgi:ABC-type multidrug transport system fused ATPase/permease subunit
LTDAVLVVAGALLVVAVFVDALMTTLALSVGSGPLTGPLLSGIWRALLRLRRAGRRSTWMAVTGPLMLILTVLIWVTLLWAGWTLVFAGSDAVIVSETRASASTTDVVYFAGMVLFTLGTGDVVAASDGWRLVSVVTAFSGLFLVTLAITYLVSVISAVVARRSLAMQVHALGGTPTEMLRLGWAGGRFTPIFEQQLTALCPGLNTAAEQHLAYPVLHYFHSADPTVSAPVQLSHLDDTLMLLQHHVAKYCRPDPAAVRPLEVAIGRYVATVSTVAWTPKVDPPPWPDPRQVRAADIPVQHLDEPSPSDGETERRTLLNALLVRDGYAWGEDATGTTS